MQQRSIVHKLSVPFTSDNDMDGKKLRAASTTMSEIFETLECRGGGRGESHKIEWMNRWLLQE